MVPRCINHSVVKTILTYEYLKLWKMSFFKVSKFWKVLRKRPSFTKLSLRFFELQKNGIFTSVSSISIKKKKKNRWIVPYAYQRLYRQCLHKLPLMIESLKLEFYALGNYQWNWASLYKCRIRRFFLPSMNFHLRNERAIQMRSSFEWAFGWTFNVHLALAGKVFVGV